MKKIISLLLALVLLCASLTLSAYAEEKEESGEPLLEEKFNEWTPFSKYDPAVHEDSWGMRINYEELYYSYNEDNTKLEWALIRSCIDDERDYDGRNMMRIGDIVLIDWGLTFRSFYPLGIYLYDGEEDTFYYITDMPGSKPRMNLRYGFSSAYEIELDESGKYKGLYEALKETTDHYPMGDADIDGSVTILDATKIQRYLACYYDKYTLTYRFNEIAADVDLDKDLTILDATRIQRYLVGLDTICGRYAEDTEETE